MNVLNFQDLSPVKKSIEVEIPADMIASEAARVTTEFGRQAKLPGFRPGKVPMNVVKTRFAKEIQEEVVNRLLPVSFRDAIKGRELEPVGDPRLEHIDPYVEGAPIKWKAEFEVKPQVELRDYRGLSITESKADVTDADIDAMVERLREQGSVFQPVSDRGLEDGDYAMITVNFSGEGIEPKSDAGHFRLGEESPLPEMQDALRGKNVGDSASFDKTYGDDAQNEAWRGKTVHHEVTLNEIRMQMKPDVTDEFAQSIGGFESVAAMRERIAADIRNHREAEVLREKRQQIGDQLVEAHEFELPEALVEEELGRSLQNYARYLASQGIDLDRVQLDWQKIAEEFRPEAAKRVKRGLILDAIAKKEGLSASDVEVDAEIRRAAADQQRDFAEVKHHLRHDGGYEQLRLSLAREKALELVLREASVRPA
jgi:trigger factor